MSTEFASAVGAVRALEGMLLTQQDIVRMTAAENDSELRDILASTGRNTTGSSEEILNALEAESGETWDFLSNYAPHDRELEILLYRNNFHNLKAALKALIMNTEPERLFIKPTSLNLAELPSLVASKQFDMLPDYMTDAAAEAYGILTESLDGQLAEAVLDTAALRAMQEEAERLKSGFMTEYAQLVTVCCDIKTAYRCSIMKKSQSFLETAVCGSPELDSTTLVREAMKGTDSFISWLGDTQWSEAADCLSRSPAAFEKWCDDAVMELAESAKTKAFGIEPLAAYFIAKETEIKNLRILLVCRSCGASPETITERMRRLYV